MAWSSALCVHDVNNHDVDNLRFKESCRTSVPLLGRFGLRTEMEIYRINMLQTSWVRRWVSLPNLLICAPNFKILAGCWDSEGWCRIPSTLSRCQDLLERKKRLHQQGEACWHAQRVRFTLESPVLFGCSCWLIFWCRWASQW